MIANDDPRRLQQRRLVNRGFTPKAVRAGSPQFEAMIDAMIDPLTPQGRCEVVDAPEQHVPKGDVELRGRTTTFEGAALRRYRQSR